MVMNEIFATAETKMNKSLNNMSSEFASIRAGRANPGVLDKLSVDYYGSPTPINQVAAGSVPEPRVLLITPWDKTALSLIEKAILTSDIGINPQNDGSMLRLSFPPLTEERRRELVKQAKKMGEESKVAMRNHRREGMDIIKKMKTTKEISEDQAADCEADVEKLVSKYMTKLEGIISAKEKELMSI